jgi:hypothetical protein
LSPLVRSTQKPFGKLYEAFISRRLGLNQQSFDVRPKARLSPSITGSILSDTRLAHARTF